MKKALVVSTCILGFAYSEARPLSTDRPDTTESPISVDQGRWQIEWECISATARGGEWEQYSLGESNIKYGLNADSDIQFVIPVYTHIKNEASGFGDIEVRWKRNLLGNDSGRFALALMPYVKLPTASDGVGNGKYEGGMMMPVSYQATETWSFGAMAQMDQLFDREHQNYHSSFLYTLTCNVRMTDSVAVFFEHVSLFPNLSSSRHEQSFNSGVTWLMNEDRQLDVGIRLNAINADKSYTPFIGFTQRY